MGSNHSILSGGDPRPKDWPLFTFRRGPFLILLLSIPFLLAGNYPQWWLDRGVVVSGVVTNDYGPVNQGQLKWIATKGYEELQANLPGGAGSNLTVLISSFSLTNASMAKMTW